ncbi:MAG: nitroreductase, partial [Bacteroidales bacterium]|nr:nitroreductase [Bacteroidales bacterium]
MDNEVLKALRERRSIRRYKPEQIKDEELQAVLEAGTWAPTGMGRQDPWIVAVQRPDLVERLDRMNGEILGSAHPFYGAPTIVLVFGSDPSVWANSTPDGSLVLGNMMLAAHAVGLGSCWINRER